MKAWLAALGETYPLTHNLGTLLGLLSDRGVAVELFEGLADLTPYAVEFRWRRTMPMVLKWTTRQRS